MLVSVCATQNGFFRHFAFADGTESSGEVADFGNGALAADPALFTMATKARQLGSELFGWLLADAIAGRPGTAIEPLYLHFEKSSDKAVQARLEALARLPWELLYRPSGAYLARETGGGVFRVAECTTGLSLPEPSWPLRVLAVSGPEDGTSIGTNEELLALRKTFVGWGRSVQLEVIERTTNQQLARAITSDCPKILHFCGHARQLLDAPAGLVTATDQPGENAHFSVDEIGELGGPEIGLIMLNACKSGVPVDQANAAIWTQSLAGMFLINGSKAVIAMQAEIAGEDGRDFAATFYQGCLGGKSVETAITSARAAIAVNNPAWAIPQLTLACLPPSDGYRLFDTDKRVRNVIPFGSEHDHTPRFTTNFHRQRRILSNWLCSTPCADSPRGPVALLAGEANTGKSHLIKWMLTNVAHLGHQCRYVDFATFSDSESVTLVRLLRTIRDGGPRNADGSIAAPDRLSAAFAPADAFNALNTALNAAFPESGPAITSPTAGSVVPDQYGTGPIDVQDAVGGSTFNEAIAQTFRSALLACAQTDPVFIVIDIGRNAKRISASELEPFLTHVVNAECAAWQHGGKKEPPIRFIFCCDPSSQASHLRPLAAWFEQNMTDPLPTIAFHNLSNEESVLRSLDEMYWYKHTNLVERLYNVCKDFGVKLSWDVCADFNTAAKAIPGLWPKLNDPVDGIKEMR